MADSAGELLRCPPAMLDHGVLRLAELRRCDQGERNASVDQLRKNPVDPVWYRLPQVALWPEVMGFVKDEHQIPASERFDDFFPQLAGFERGTATQPQAHANGPEKGNVIVCAWH